MSTAGSHVAQSVERWTLEVDLLNLKLLGT